MPVTLENLTAKLDAVILADDAEQDEEVNIIFAQIVSQRLQSQPRQLGEVVAVKARAKDASADIIGFLKLLTSKSKDKTEDTEQGDETIKSNCFIVPIAPIRPDPSSVIMFQPASKRIPRYGLYLK